MAPFILIALALALLALAKLQGFSLLLASKMGAGQDAFCTVHQVDTLTVTASTTGAGRMFSVAGKRKCVWFALCTAAAGGVSVVVAAQQSIDGGSNFVTQDSFSAITALGLSRKDPSAETGPNMRFFWTESGGGTATLKMYAGYIEPSVYNARD